MTRSASEMKEVLERRKRWMLVGLAIFLMTSAMAIVVNSFMCRHGLEASRSISRYVGFEAWSAIVFALGNFWAAGATTAYLWGLGEAWKMPRVFYYLTFLMGLGLVCLSVWPLGYFDTAAGKGPVSFAHEIASRTMFAMMLLVAAMLAFRKQNRKVSRLMAGVYALYGVACILGYFTKSNWFTSGFMFYEALYIAAFVVMLIGQKEKVVA